MAECLEEIRECLEKGWTGLGFKTLQFEEAWRRYTGLPHAHYLNSNSSGLHLALRVLKARCGWRDGDEVITTPLTFVSTNHAILHECLKPVFADVDRFLCLDPADIERRITARTRAVMFVGIGGNAGQYLRVCEICRDRGLALILDAAHMAGTTVQGRHIGAEADAAVFSFNAVKNLPTGDSGMLCFNRPDDDAVARRLSWLGIDKDTYARTRGSGSYQWRYDVEEIGFNYHGNSLMAAVGLVQLKYLDADNEVRRRIAGWYAEQLQGLAGLAIVPEGEECRSARHLFQVRVKDRDALLLELNDNEIYPGVHYRDNTEYPMYAESAGTCAQAQRASQELLSLPLHLSLSSGDVERVCRCIRRWVEQNRRG